MLSETALVLVIESSLQGYYVRSTHDLPLNATKLFPFFEHEEPAYGLEVPYLFILRERKTAIAVLPPLESVWVANPSKGFPPSVEKSGKSKKRFRL